MLKKDCPGINNYMIDTIQYKCDHCNKSFEKIVWEITRDRKNYPNAKFYCSKECRHNARKKQIPVKCVYCNKDFTVRPNKIKRNKIGTFCSVECYDKYKKEIWNKKTINCPVCNKLFTVKKSGYESTQRRRPAANFYCSKQCNYASQRTEASKMVDVKCAHCGKEEQRQFKTIRYTKHDVHFCTSSCRAKYFAKINALGAQRSELENRIEQHIKAFYPNLMYTPNDRDILGGLELDFYFPTLHLAVEINGPAHFIPIWNEETLKRTHQNDMIKINYCKKKNIRLLHITDILDRKNDNSLEIFTLYIKPILDELIEIENNLQNRIIKP